jgi:hypothetical protein
MLPQLIWFMRSITSSPNVDVDLLGDAISELVEMFNGIVNGTHINVFMLDECSKNREGGPLGQQYIYEYIKMLILLSQHLKHYPKLEDQVISSYQAINKEILLYIYDNPQQQVADICSVLSFTMVDLLAEYILQVMGGNKLIEDKLVKVVDAGRFLMAFLNRKVHIKHRPNIIRNLASYWKMSASYQTNHTA